MVNQITGTNKAGRRLSVLQSLRFSKERPLAVIINPPTISSSAIKASLIADEEIRAISQNIPCQQNKTGAANTIPMPYVDAKMVEDTKSNVALVKRNVWSPFKALITGPNMESGPMQ